MLSLIVLLLILIFLPVLVYAHRIEPHYYDITAPDIHIKNLAPEFDGYRIVHISDIHMDKKTSVSWVEDIVERVNQQDADMIVITGDFVTRNPHHMTSEIWDIVGQLSAPDGVFAVLGNHDYLHHTDDLRRILRNIGITELTNNAVRIKRDNTHFYLAGVDDVCYGQPDLETLKSKMPDNAPAILLAHEPDFADITMTTGRFDLQLSGHTHGGQINFPIFGIIYRPRHGKKYLSGHYRIGNALQLYVTRGVGTVSLPLRFNCRPEITVITLRN